MTISDFGILDMRRAANRGERPELATPGSGVVALRFENSIMLEERRQGSMPRETRF